MFTARSSRASTRPISRASAASPACPTARPTTRRTDGAAAAIDFYTTHLGFTVEQDAALLQELYTAGVLVAVLVNEELERLGVETLPRTLLEEDLKSNAER